MSINYPHHESAHHLSTMNLFYHLPIIYLTSIIHLFVCLPISLPVCHLLSLPLHSHHFPYMSTMKSAIIWAWHYWQPDIWSHSLKLGEITFCCLRLSIYGVNSIRSIYSIPNWLKSLWSDLDLCVFNKTPNNIHREVLYILHFELKVSRLIFITWIRKHMYIYASICISV